MLEFIFQCRSDRRRPSEVLFRAREINRTSRGILFSSSRGLIVRIIHCYGFAFDFWRTVGLLKYSCLLIFVRQSSRRTDVIHDYRRLSIGSFGFCRMLSIVPMTLAEQ